MMKYVPVICSSFRFLLMETIFFCCCKMFALASAANFKGSSFSYSFIPENFFARTHVYSSDILVCCFLHIEAKYMSNGNQSNSQSFLSFLLLLLHLSCFSSLQRLLHFLKIVYFYSLILSLLVKIQMNKQRISKKEDKVH